MLAAADDLSTWPQPSTAGLWPRAAALLARQALEAALDDYWALRAPGVERSSMRAQLVCLRELADEDTGERASHAWWALSRACHHHPYELSPTASELTEWIASVETVMATLEGSQKSPVTSPPCLP